MKRFAASKYFLQVREKSVDADVSDDLHYRYFDTKAEAVSDLIERENAAIARLEKQLKNANANLQQFKRKQGIA